MNKFIHNYTKEDKENPENNSIGTVTGENHNVLLTENLKKDKSTISNHYRRDVKNIRNVIKEEIMTVSNEPDKMGSKQRHKESPNRGHPECEEESKQMGPAE